MHLKVIYIRIFFLRFRKFSRHFRVSKSQPYFSHNRPYALIYTTNECIIYTYTDCTHTYNTHTRTNVLHDTHTHTNIYNINVYSKLIYARGGDWLNSFAYLIAFRVEGSGGTVLRKWIAFIHRRRYNLHQPLLLAGEIYDIYIRG